MEKATNQMNEIVREPNLFDFAPGELSQDAVLCWLLSWADSQFRNINAELHRTACSFLTLLFRKHDLDCPPSVGVTVHRQVDHADILAEVGDKYVVLIEDKTTTKHHGDQLNRYLRTIKRRYPGRQILPVFLKTGNQCEFGDVESCGYHVCARSDILSCISSRSQERISSDVLRNWAEYLSRKEESVRAFASKPVSDWDWEQWVGLYEALKSHISDFYWDYVPNKSGGFMGAWWGWQKVGAATLYLQIEGRDLCFKINAGNAANRAPLRELWHKRLIRCGRSARKCKPQRPSRFGNGKTMTIAIVPQDKWLSIDGQGTLNLRKTLGTLNAATRLLKTATGPGRTARRVG